MQRAVIILNPMSRNAPPRARLDAAAKALAADGWQVDVRVTEAAGHATEIARDAAASGLDVAFSCGGDGTINEVANGLATTQTALGVLRGGMGDVFGREVGIPKAPEQALRVLLDGERRRFDLGLANNRYFLLMAGVGFDAEVVRAVPSTPKKLLGSTSYALWGAWQLARYRPRSVIVRLDGEELDVRLYWLLLGNTRSYGGIVRIASKALVDDGKLDAFLFEGGSIGRLASSTARILRGRLQDAPGVATRQVRELEVVSAGLHVQLDGEYVGQTPMRFGVAPATLDVLLPKGHGADLFSRAAGSAAQV